MAILCERELHPLVVYRRRVKVTSIKDALEAHIFRFLHRLYNNNRYKNSRPNSYRKEHKQLCGLSHKFLVDFDTLCDTGMYVFRATILTSQFCGQSFKGTTQNLWSFYSQKCNDRKFLDSGTLCQTFRDQLQNSATAVSSFFLCERTDYISLL